MYCVGMMNREYRNRVAVQVDRALSEEPFKTELRSILKQAVARLRRQGTVAMSKDCLWQNIAVSINPLPHAPKGTNCAWVARQVFDSIVSEKAFANFVYA